MSGFNHYIPSREREEHEISEECICAPRLVLEKDGIVVKNVYFEHFALDGSEGERQVYQ